MLSSIAHLTSSATAFMTPTIQCVGSITVVTSSTILLTFYSLVQSHTKAALVLGWSWGGLRILWGIDRGISHLIMPYTLSSVLNFNL